MTDLAAPDTDDVLDAFARTLTFTLDGFQREGCRSVAAGRSVLVAAPTGAGKTIVADFAVYSAMQSLRDKVFYTTPMKALSNQKFQELGERYGVANVGLLTGDTNINSTARIVVMTTEVLRNMLYANSALLGDLAYVVMDEVHYLADRFRGAVWEEVIIQLNRRVRLVCLSATVSNAEEFGDWIQEVRGATDIVVSEFRPVPLQQHVLVDTELVDLFDATAAPGTVSSYLTRLGTMGHSGGARRHNRGRRPARTPRADRIACISVLRRNDLLPAIFFIFSRAGCEAAVQQTGRADLGLTTESERARIREIVELRCRDIPDEDRGVLGYWGWVESLQRGVAAHHAGMLPPFKEVVEELFLRRLIKVVFATETLALGINMPARTVFLERLDKFNGESRVPITPGEYTQLTGRAGRRGIDTEGHAVIQWRADTEIGQLASLATKRSYPLYSSFKPTYNMAVNLIDQLGRERTRDTLESSFAQFQADRAVVGLARKLATQRESLAGYEKSMRCHLGDFREYARLRRQLSDAEREYATAAHRGDGGVKRSVQGRIDRLRAELRKHPCHQCPDREKHARWGERWNRLNRQTELLEKQIRGRTSAISRVFDRVVDILLELGYLSDDGSGGLHTTEAGVRLKRIYGERDLVVAECIRQDVWAGVDAATLAALVSTLVYEPRGRDDGAPPPLPKGPFREAFARMESIWSRLDEEERDGGMPGTAPLEPGFAHATRRWAAGVTLDRVLGELDTAAGDFVRVMKQIVDVLDQIAQVAPPEVAETAQQALGAVRRGVVYYSSVA